MAQIYIVGDVVMYDNKIMVIKEPRDRSHFDLSCPKEGLVYCFVGVDEIKPVSLNPWILEKNGWWKDYCIGNEDRYAKYDFLYISYYRNDNTTKLFVKGLTLLSNIKYVHQLQHLLFGLGLSMDLKV